MIVWFVPKDSALNSIAFTSLLREPFDWHLLGSQKAWTTPFLVPLRGQNKNFRRASLTFSYGKRSCPLQLKLVVIYVDITTIHLLYQSLAATKVLLALVVQAAKCEPNDSSQHQSYSYANSSLTATAEATCPTDKHRCTTWLVVVGGGEGGVGGWEGALS